MATMQNLNRDSLPPMDAVKAIYNSPNVVCPKCGSKVFKEGLILKSVSALVSPTGKAEIYPIPVYVCNECGTIPNEFMEKSAAKQILGEEQQVEKEESNILIK